MKKTLTEQYRLIKEDKGHKGVFLKEAKKQFPNLIRQGATYNEASKILKQKNIISENFVGTPMVGNPLERKKEGFENAFENFLKEAKAEEKKVSKEVEEDQSKGYDTADKKDPNNMIFGQIQMGYYCELKNPKNADKTEQEIKDIVFKNLEKDPIYYTKNGQFGEEGIGYTDDNVSLGIPEEPKGEHKSSGYGKLKEHKRRRRKLIKEGEYTYMNDTNAEFGPDVLDLDYDKIRAYISSKKGQDFADDFIDGYNDDFYENVVRFFDKIENPTDVQVLQFIDSEIEKTRSKYPPADNAPGGRGLNEHSVSTVGGIVTGTGFVGVDYMDYFGLNEIDPKGMEASEKSSEEIDKNFKSIKSTIDSIELEEDMYSDSTEDAIIDTVEELYDDLGDIEEVMDYMRKALETAERSLRLKYGDY